MLPIPWIKGPVGMSLFTNDFSHGSELFAGILLRGCKRIDFTTRFAPKIPWCLVLLQFFMASEGEFP